MIAAAHRRAKCALVAAAIVTSGCATGTIASTPDTTTPPTTNGTETTMTETMATDGSVVAAHAGEAWFLGTVPDRATPADATAAPIRLGMINQEQTDLGSYPEMRAAVEAAVAWVNAELGGVGGRPVEVVPCVTPFDPAASRACATQLVEQGVVAFVGGVDVMSTESIGVIESSGLVSIGGVPATLAEQRSANAFFFSGGDSGALAGFMADAHDRGASRVAVAYGQEVESFEVAARDYGAVVGASLGLDVTLVPYPIFTTDFTDLRGAVVDSGAEALIVLAATSACVPVMTTVADLDIRLYLTGACAGSATIAAAGDAARGVVFNAEGPVDGVDVEASIFQDVIDRYADEPAGGAGTVAFRGFMNLYALMLEAGPDDVTSSTLARLARASVNRASFWGHPYTCDGNQIPGLPALCAPQQVLFVVEDGLPRGISGWIATDELFAAAFGR